MYKRILILLAIAICFSGLFVAADRELILPRGGAGEGIRLRDFPYPYGAMAALVNDCDNNSLRAFERYHRFLNTRSQTIYGEGLALDVSDSFFAYSAAADHAGLMTWFDGTDPEAQREARKIERYIRCGWIDAIHSYGDFSAASAEEGAGAIEVTRFSRGFAIDAYAALYGGGLFPLIWSDHGNEGNAQNFGSLGPWASASYKRGDDMLSAEYYHTDVTLAGGVKYVWDARPSNIFGYDFPLAARALRDGSGVWSFGRYTGGTDGENAAGGAGVVWDWYPDRLRYEITAERLDSLVADRKYGLFAQHLGFYGEDYILAPEDVAALRLLAEYCHERKTVLIAGTARLFEYATSHKYVRYSYRGGTINITAVDDPLFPDYSPSVDRVRGLTFYCEDPANINISLRGEPLPESEIVRNPPDSETGRPSVSVRWHAPDAVDYTHFG